MNLEERLARSFLQERPADAAAALERMPASHRAAVVHALAADAGAALGEMLPDAVADCAAHLDPGDAASVLQRLPADRAAAVLRRLPPDPAERALAALPADTQELVRRVLRYREGTVGALMNPLVPELPVDILASEARLRLRRARGETMSEVFVVDRSRTLVGTLDVAALLRAGPRVPIRTLLRIRTNPLPAWLPLASARAHRGWDVSLVLPVTDDSGRLVGALQYETLERVVQKRAGRGEDPGPSATVVALGELFHLGLAGLVEGVATAADPRGARLARATPRYDEERR